MQIVNVCAPGFDWADSYGRLACELVRHLVEDQGVYVNAYSWGPETDHQPDDIRPYLQRPKLPAVGGIFLGYPTLTRGFGTMLNNGPQMLITNWESTELPSDWPPLLNKFDAISVASVFVRDVMIEHGAACPVEVHPLGLSPSFQPVQRARRRKPFTFLAIADRGRRKGWDAAVLAFARLYKNNPDFRLILKARSEKSFPYTFPNVSNIEIIREDLTDEGMRDLYARADCFIFPARGEGFGLPPREAAATGLPVIATNWSGTADDIRKWAYPLRYTLVEAWSDQDNFRGLGQWAEPDQDHLCELMQHVVAGNPYVQHMAEQATRRVRNLYRWDRFAAQVLGLWNRVNEKEAVI